MSSSYLRIYRQTPRFTSCTWRWRVRGASWWRRCRSAKQSWPGRTGTWLTWGVRGSSRSTGWAQHCCLTNMWCLFQRGKDYSALQKYSCHLNYKRQSFHWDFHMTDQHFHFIAYFVKMKGERLLCSGHPGWYFTKPSFIAVTAATLYAQSPPALHIQRLKWLNVQWTEFI